MKIAITGITGFIGRSLAQKLSKQGHDVSGLIHSPGKAAFLPEGIKKVYGDILNKNVLKETFESCDLIYHCAAVVNGGKKKMMLVNVRGTEAVCEVARDMHIDKIIYLSSIAVISGNDGPYPLTEALPYAAYNDYGISKIESEKVARNSMKGGLNIAIIRPSAVYGRDEPHVLSGILKLSRLGILPLAGKGFVQWQLIHIDDLTDFLISIINNNHAYNDIFNVSSGETIEMINLYRLIMTFTHKGRIIRIPLWPLKLMAGVADIPFNIQGKRPFMNKVKFFERHHTYDTAKARDLLGLKTSITLHQGLAQIFGPAPART